MQGWADPASGHILSNGGVLFLLWGGQMDRGSRSSWSSSLQKLLRRGTVTLGRPPCFVRNRPRPMFFIVLLLFPAFPLPPPPCY